MIRATDRRRRILFAAALLVGAGGMLPWAALAQDIRGVNPAQVSPGALYRSFQRRQQQIEQQNQPPPLQGPAVVAPAPAPAAVGQPGGPTFVLREVQFSPSVFLSPQELDAIAARFVGRSVDFAGLQQIVQDVNALYEAKGQVTASASLGPQRITDGRVKITLTEGRLGAVKVDGREQTSQEFLDRRLALKPGEVVNVPALTDQARLLNRTSDVQVRLSLQPGANFGLTDIALSVIEPPRHTLQFFADNQGVKTTGSNEVGMFYKLDGVTGIDDRLTFYGTWSEGDLAGNIGYNLPIGIWGTRVGVSAGSSAIHIVNGPTQPLEVTGQSYQSSANISQPLYVDPQWTVQALGSFTWMESKTDQSGFQITHDQSLREAIGFSVGNVGEWGSFMISPAVAPVQSDSFITHRARSFTLGTGTGNATVLLPSGFSLFGTWAWQLADTRLLPADQLFQLGGPTTVRGFPIDSLAGDSGAYINLEVHHSLPVGDVPLDLFAFTDAGMVASTYPTSKTMTSVGIGASATFFDRFTLQGTIGIPIGLSVPDQGGVAFYARLIVSAF